MLRFVGYAILGYLLFLGFYAGSQGLMTLVFAALLHAGIKLGETFIDVVCYAVSIGGAVGVIYWLWKTPKFKPTPKTKPLPSSSTSVKE